MLYNKYVNYNSQWINVKFVNGEWKQAVTVFNIHRVIQYGLDYSKQIVLLFARWWSTPKGAQLTQIMEERKKFNNSFVHLIRSYWTVSYTHLDVYKRQNLYKGDTEPLEWAETPPIDAWIGTDLLEF